MNKSERPLWKCPKCGHRFVTKNLWHSCGRHSVADHFEGTDPKVRELFDRFTAMVEACGPVTIYAQQTRIVCQVRVRFAGVTPRERSLDVTVWLTRPVQHAKLRRTELIPPSAFVHHFRFREPTELDDAFMAIVREGYAVGRQEHLERPAPKPRRPRRKKGTGKKGKSEKREPAKEEKGKRESKKRVSEEPPSKEGEKQKKRRSGGRGRKRKGGGKKEQPQSGRTEDTAAPPEEQSTS
ncbi:MAG: hypothetical protein GTO22_07305 [Gemmatimonadales bacterium]|nr:hypothetical protein [Gemmatimonadales bacterium]